MQDVASGINWTAVSTGVAACSLFAGLIIGAVNAIINARIQLVLSQLENFARQLEAKTVEQAQLVERQRQTDLRLQDFYSRLHKCLDIGCDTTAH
jgi:hypothetical protein